MEAIIECTCITLVDIDEARAAAMASALASFAANGPDRDIRLQRATGMVTKRVRPKYVWSWYFHESWKEISWQDGTPIKGPAWIPYD